MSPLVPSDIDSGTTLRGPSQGNALSRAGATLPVVEPGRYAIAGEMAHGGIGRILRARDTRLDRPVAIKELLAPDTGAEPRFVAEALVTARLQHPSIVPVYEAGRWPGGEPFYAMKLVSGRSLAEVIAEKKTLEERLALLPHVLAVAEAMAYAHSERIIHRDLKPANVLVGEFGETVVIDWGLAKDLTREEERTGEDLPGADAEDGTRTRVGTVMGTPAYMPPEQAAGRPVDERADVYALGAILYHLLAGTQPYDGGSSAQVLQQVVQGPPPPLSKRQKCIPADLLAIVAKAMARDPAGRYATAREVVEDLKRFHTGQIVGAYQYSRVELLRRFIRRYRAAVTVTGVALLLLAGLEVASFRRVMAERDRAAQKHAEAEVARRDAEEARQVAVAQADELLLVQARNALELDPNNAVSWLRRLSPGFSRWSAVRTLAADAQSHGFATVLRGHSQVINDLLFSPDGRRLVSGSDDYSIRLWDLEQGTSRVLSGHSDEVWRFMLAPDGRSFISSGKDATLRRWDLETGEGRVFATLAGSVSALCGSKDRRLLFAHSRVDDLLHIWEWDSGRVRTVHTGQPGAAELQVSPDSGYVLLRTVLNEVVLGDLTRGAFQRLDGSRRAGGMAFSPSGDLVVVGSGEELLAWETRSGRRRVLGEHLGFVFGLAFSPDGKHLAFATKNGDLRLLELATGRERKVGRYEEGEVIMGLHFSPDGQYLASHGNGRASRLWELSTGDSQILRGAPDSVYDAAFSPEGRYLATGSSDGTVRLFDVRARNHRVLFTAPGPLRALVRSPDGRRLVTMGPERTLRLLDTAGGAPLLEERGHSLMVPAFSADGRWLVSGGSDGRIHLREGSSGRTERVLEGHGRAITALAFSRDGRWLASADEGGEVRRWELASGEGRTLGRHEGKVLRLTFSPGGERLASVGQDKTARVWESGSGEGRVLLGHEDTVLSVSFSPDGTKLVTGSRDHTLRFWDLESGRSQRLDASGGGVEEVLFSPDGALVAIRSMKDPRIQLRDGRTGELRSVLRGHTGDVLDLAFSPDGTRLASASVDKSVMIRDLASGEARRLQGHAGYVTGVEFLPDGRTLVSSGADGTVRLWSDELPWEQQALRAWMETVDD